MNADHEELKKTRAGVVEERVQVLIRTATFKNKIDSL